MGFLAFIILLPIVVFVHEFGHFLFARINSVRVESFSIGFGPTLFSWTDKHTTKWKVSLIPLGGYVKMLGQSDTPETVKEKENKRNKLSAKEKSESFEFKKRYQKASIVAAGPLFNFILGFILFFCLYFFSGIQTGVPVVSGIEKDSPAYTAGIQKGDKIISINNNKISNIDSVRNMIVNSNGNALNLTVLRDNKNITIKATPTKKGDSYFLGIAYGFEAGEYEKIGFVSSITHAYSTCENIVSGTLKSLYDIIAGNRSSRELGGIYSIAKIGGEALEHGCYSFIYLIAFISISLGLFNILPIPVLDGGYLFIYIIEGIIRRDLPEIIKSVVFFMGFALIIFLLLLSNINDVIRIFG